MALKKWLLAQGVPASEVNARGVYLYEKYGRPYQSSGRPGKRIGKGELLHLADTYGLRGAAPSNGSAWYTPAWSSCTYVQTPPRSEPVSNRTMQRSLDADVNRVKKEAKVEDTKKYNAQLAAQEIDTAKFVVVSGAGADDVNGVYTFGSTYDERPCFTCSDTGFDLWYSAKYKHWRLGKPDDYYYTSDDKGGLLPTDWKVSPTDWSETNQAALGTTPPSIAVAEVFGGDEL